MLHCWPMYKAEKAQGARFAGPLSMKCESRPGKSGQLQEQLCTLPESCSSSSAFLKLRHVETTFLFSVGSSERKLNFLLFLFKKKNQIHNCNTWVSSKREACFIEEGS